MGMRWCVAMVMGVALAAAAPARGQSADEADVLAVADAALAAITSEDWEDLTDLMVPGAQMYAPRRGEGGWTMMVRTREQQLAASSQADVVERGFDPTVMAQGPVAMVWYPYDLYLDGQWLHCGVDIFSLGRTDDGWRIVSLAWSQEQPPDCQPHPDGPPPGATGPGSS